MTDEELLQAYKPILCFAHSERFFPMDVRPYVKACWMFKARRLAGGTLAAKEIESLSKFEGDRFFLRFVNYNEPWHVTLVWLVSTIFVLAAGIMFHSRLAIEGAIVCAGTLALFFYLSSSKIRLRLLSAIWIAVVAVVSSLRLLYFVNQEALTDWVFLILATLATFVVANVLLGAVRLLFGQVISELPGFVLDLMSNATEQTAEDAFQKYAQILDEDDQPVYFGRVVSNSDSRGNAWTILQYHFLYAFNDWRFAANGLNHHEGDWEMIAVYLRNDKPYAVLCSQHHDGSMEYWERAPKVTDEMGREHLLIYVALGSHANYSRPAVIQLPEQFKEGNFRKALYLVDAFIRMVWEIIKPGQRSRRIAAQRLGRQTLRTLSMEQRKITKDSDADEFVVGLPTEYATGDGIRIDCPEDATIDTLDSDRFLKTERYARKTKHPSRLLSRIELLSAADEWVEYQGLWGVSSLLADESGPPGPKWNRAVGGNRPTPRLRWAEPLLWLDQLENAAIDAR